MIKYREIKEDDLNQIVRIHKEAFPDYFLTAFGEELLYEFYNQYFLNNNVFVVAEKDKKIMGFILGNNSDIPRKNFFKKNFYKISLKIIIELLKLNKNLWAGIFQRIVLVREAIVVKIIKRDENDKVSSYKYDLLSIAVDKDSKGNGVAFKLEEYFCSKLKQNGIKEIILAVKKENIQAIKFYEKCNYIYMKDEKKLKYYRKIIN